MSDSRNSDAFSQRKCLSQICIFLGLQQNARFISCYRKDIKKKVNWDVLIYCASVNDAFPSEAYNMRWVTLFFTALWWWDICIFVPVKKTYHVHTDTRMFLSPFPMLSTFSSVTIKLRSLNCWIIVEQLYWPGRRFSSGAHIPWLFLKHM